MTTVILISAVLLVLLVAWIIGEVKNIRALRLPGAIAPLLIVPLAFEVGSVVGHGRAYVAAREATGDFLLAVGAAVERGDTAGTLKEMRWLHECTGERDKRAGSFFFEEMYYAKSRLVNAPAPYPDSTPE